jgi:Flp pilus assembly protein TadG
MTMRRTRRTASTLQAGAAAVELALLFLPISVLAFGTTDMARAMQQYNSVAKAVRDASRYLSNAPGNIDAARCLAITGTPAMSGSSCSGTALLPGLTLAQVYACDETLDGVDARCANHMLQPYGTAGTANAGIVNLVSVTVTGFTFTSAVPFAAPSFTFGAVRSTMSKKI